jgi:hypothetical protein
MTETVRPILPMAAEARTRSSRQRPAELMRLTAESIEFPGSGHEPDLLPRPPKDSFPWSWTFLISDGTAPRRRSAVLRAGDDESAGPGQITLDGREVEVDTAAHDYEAPEWKAADPRQRHRAAPRPGCSRSRTVCAPWPGLKAVHGKFTMRADLR